MQPTIETVETLLRSMIIDLDYLTTLPFDDDIRLELRAYIATLKVGLSRIRALDRAGRRTIKGG